MFATGDQIARPGILWVEHHGIVDLRGGIKVIHADFTSGRVVESKLEDFGGPVRLVYRPGAGRGELVADRARERLGRRFSLLGFNCEHLAYGAAMGVAVSPQVLLGVGALALVGGLVTALTFLSSPVQRPRPGRGGPRESPPGDPAAWIRLATEGPLHVRNPPRSWTSDSVRQLLQRAAAVAPITIGDVGPAVPGSRFDPHLSHRWGRDVDVSYRGDRWIRRDEPRPPADPAVFDALEVVAPWIETVGMSAARAAEAGPRPYPISVWPGHDRHMHVRFFPATVAASAA